MLWHSRHGCNRGIPYERRLQAQLLDFQSSSTPLCLGKQWALATPMGNPNGVPGTWLLPDPAPAVAAIWELKQQMKDLSQRSLPLTLPFK